MVDVDIDSVVIGGDPVVAGVDPGAAVDVVDAGGGLASSDPLPQAMSSSMTTIEVAILEIEQR